MLVGQSIVPREFGIKLVWSMVCSVSLDKGERLWSYFSYGTKDKILPSNKKIYSWWLGDVRDCNIKGHITDIIRLEYSWWKWYMFVFSSTVITMFVGFCDRQIPHLGLNSMSILSEQFPMVMYLKFSMVSIQVVFYKTMKYRLLV